MSLMYPYKSIKWLVATRQQQQQQQKVQCASWFIETKSNAQTL